MPNKELTIQEVRKKYGDKLSYGQVVYACMTGKIKAKKRGWQWFILESDLPQVWPVQSKSGR